MRKLTVELTLFLDMTDFTLRQDAVTSFSDENTGDKVTFRTSTENERKDGAQLVVAIARGAREINRHVTEFMEDLAAGRIPRAVKGADLNSWWDFIEESKPFRDREVTREDRLDPKFVIRNEVLPEGVTKGLNGLVEALVSIATRAARILRWRLKLGGSQALVRRAVFLDRWSIDDGENWSHLPFSLGIGGIFVIRPRALSDEELRFISEALFENPSDSAEPLAHELLHEGVTQILTAPRSAFIMAITAAEVALKSLIVMKMPDAGWLVENIPSPPIVSIATEYIPALTGERLPEGIVDDLKVGVNLRNKLVHSGKANVSPERLERTCSSVRRLLYWIDALSGNEWAREFL